MMPKVSIIIPCYNVANYIDRCLTSVINQSYNDFEIILINDGDTDKTLKKCVEWQTKDKRIILISKKNEGQGIARNFGIKIAKGEYITFLDADDWWNKDYLSEMLLGTQNFNNDIVICDFNYHTETKEGAYNQITLIRLSNGKINLDSELHVLSRARTQAWGKLYRKTLFTENKIKAPYYKYEDVAITPYIVAKSKSIYHVDKPLYFYLKNRLESTINQFSNLQDLLSAMRDLIENFKNDNLFSKHYNELRRIFWGELCFLYRMLDTKFSENDEKKASRLRDKCKKIVYGVFPELETLSKMKFYVKDDLLKQAVGYITLTPQQICNGNDFNTSDIAVCFEEAILPKDFKGIAIHAQKPENNDIDPEKPVWDLADEVFDKLCTRL